VLKITIDWRSRGAIARTKAKPSRGATLSKLGSILCSYNLFQPSGQLSVDGYVGVILNDQGGSGFSVCMYILFEAEAEAKINSTIRVASRLDLRDVIDTHAQLHVLL
jgi:hypothetical protein